MIITMMVMVMVKVMMVMTTYQVSCVGRNHDEGEKPPEGGDHPSGEGTANRCSTSIVFSLKSNKNANNKRWFCEGELKTILMWRNVYLQISPQFRWMIRPIPSHIYSFSILRPKCSYLRFVKRRSFIFLAWIHQIYFLKLFTTLSKNSIYRLSQRNLSSRSTIFMCPYCYCYYYYHYYYCYYHNYCYPYHYYYHYYHYVFSIYTLLHVLLSN